MTLERARAEVTARLRARQAEIERAILVRAHAIADPGNADPIYRQGLRGAVSVATDYALETIERGEDRSPPPPPALLAQARIAARGGIGLDVVLRRYLAGYTLLGDYLTQEARQAQLSSGTTVAQLLSGWAAILDRLLAAVSEEYAHESRLRPESSEQRRADRVERLLAGEPIDASGLAYDFEADHLGLVASGGLPTGLVRDLSIGLDCRTLVVRRSEGMFWVWLGSRQGVDPAAAQAHLRRSSLGQATVALGEAGRGIAGWRLSHRQAAAALAVAQVAGDRMVRYAEVALVASAVQDDLLSTSLRQLFLAPLEDDRDGGRTAKQTLRAYITCGRNVTSAAAHLGVNRNTVASRLRTIEHEIGRPIDACAAELELCLRLADLSDTAVS